MSETNLTKAISLTSHPSTAGEHAPIHWHAGTAAERGPLIGSLTDVGKRNVMEHIQARTFDPALATPATASTALSRRGNLPVFRNAIGWSKDTNKRS